MPGQPDDPIFECDPFDLAERLLADVSSEPIRPADFGPFRFLEDRPLGIGTMGEVWLAAEEAANRRVAIKLLRSTSQPDVWARREIKRLGAIEHKNIARLYNHGILEDGTPWLAMEYVEGEPLDKFFRERCCSVRERLVLFRAICEAVQYAHGRGIIHGDLKPSNIRVRSDGEPMLLDFGLSEQYRNDDGTLTQSPTALGFTPAYAAPEQFRGEPVGVHIDVYALGVIFFELLTGELPFDASTHTYAKMREIKTGGRKPELPSLIAAPINGPDSRIRKTEWRDLDEMCFKAMEHDVYRRYSTVEAVIWDLDRFERCEPVQARQPQSWSYRAGKFLRRRKVAVLTAALVVLAVAGLVSYFTLQLARERNAAVAEAARTQKVKQYFLDLFDHAAEDAQPAEKTRIANLFLDRGVRDARSLGHDPAMQVDIYQGFAKMYQEWGVLDRAERLAHDALAIAEGRAPQDRTQVLKAKLALGRVLEERGQYNDAIKIGDEVARSQPAQSEYSASLTLLANAYIHLGQFSVADSFNQQALSVDRQLYGPGHPEVADDLMNQGDLQVQRGDYVQAERFFRQALAINQSWFGKESSQAADSASYVAQALYFQGGHEAEAARLLTDALAALEKAHGTSDTRVAFTVATKGSVAIDLGNLDEAEADFRQAAEIYRAVRGDGHQSVAIELANVASIVLKKQQYARADGLFRDVIQRFSSVLPADNLNIGIARIKLGDSLVGEKRYRDAEGELLAGYQIVAKQSSPSVSWLKTARQDLHAVYTALNQPERAAKFQAESAAQK